MSNFKEDTKQEKKLGQLKVCNFLQMSRQFRRKRIRKKSMSIQFENKKKFEKKKKLFNLACIKSSRHLK